MKKYDMMKVLAVILILVSLTAMQGCFKKENPNLETYREYVKAILDVNYHGEYDAYEQISGSNNGSEVHEGCVESIKDSLISEFAIEEDVITSDMQNKLSSIAETLCSNAEYTVDKAEYQDDAYTVKVNVKPSDFYTVANKNLDLFISEFNDRAAQGEFLDLSETEYETEYAQGVIELLEKSLGEASVTEDQSYVITILVNDKGESYVSDDELAEISKLLFPDKE